MDSRFIFLEDDCPKLAEYGRRAEECIASDPNICLLCLGRIAEIITENLCRRSNIADSPGKLEALIGKGIITDDISRKIAALTETKSEAANEGYDSESACSRLMLTAEELCRWFITVKAEGRFRFLADIFPPDKPVPILINISELGREAEENLYSNTRYCLICLGDMGEAIADRLISENAIETHERDQIDRIDVLSDSHKVTEDAKNILHSLRIARNKALHERYNDEYTSESEGRRLIDDALKLCEWLFMMTIKPGYVVKARITGETGGGYSAVIGRLPAQVPHDEVPEGKSCMAGKKYVFKVSDIESDTVTLSMSLADNDYNLSLARLYAKYKPGQDVHVTIKSLSNSTGAIVELKDGLEARIPPSELGRKIYRYDEDHTKMVKYETVARVKWFSLTQYPPMLLSVKDVEDEPEKPSVLSPVPARKPAMSDLDFRLFCKSASYEKMIQALDEGANPKAANRNNTTALMMAAQFNQNARAVKALIDAGAEVGAKNHRGNTALIYAAMRNNADVVSVIYEAGADIGTVNLDGRTAADYAVKNRKLNGTDILRILRNEPEQELSLTESELPHESSQPEPEAHELSLTEPEAHEPSLTESEAHEHSQPEPEAHEPSQPETEACEPSQPESEAHEPSLTEPEAHEVPQTETEAHEPSQPESEAHEPSLTEPEAHEVPQTETEAHEVPQTEPEAHEPSPTESEAHEPSPTESEAPHEVPQTEAELPQEEYDEDTYYKYGINDSDTPTKEDEEEISALRRKLQRDFLKICRSGTEDDIAEAVSAGVNVNVTNKSSATALMFAAQSNTAQAVEILIHAGAFLDAQDDNGNTALIYAASYNNDDVVDTLIDAGADSNITNLAGHKASDYAARNYRLIDTETVKRL